MIQLSELAFRQRMQALAALDAVLMPAFEYRYFSFDSAWDVGEQMGSVSNGSGDHLFAHFSEAGVFVVGFEHELPNRQAVFDGLPAEFEACRTEPAFMTDHANLCVWCLAGQAWRSADVDQATGLLDLVLTDASAHADWAADYYETPVAIEVVEHLFANRPLTAELVRGIYPDRDLDDLAEELDEIGYPWSMSR